VIFLLHTNAVSDWMRGDPKIRARIAALSPNDRIGICTITHGEVLFGIERLPHGKRRRKLAGNARLAFSAFPHLSIPEPAGDRYAQLKLKQEKSGLSLDENDLWTAAVTLATGATLISRDSDFGRIDGFPVEDWTK
jgi:predicted nucleic acid-binding protein